MWSFICTLQLIAHLPLFNSRMSGLAEYFFLNLLKIVRLDLFEVRDAMKQILGYPLGLNGISSHFNNAGYDSHSSIILLGLLMVFIYLEIAILAIAGIVQVLLKAQKSTKNVLSKAFNFCLRLNLLLSLELLICTFVNFYDFRNDTSSDTLAVLFSLAVFILLMVLTVFVLSKFIRELQDEEGKTHQALKTLALGARKNNFNTVLFQSWFLLQRIAYASAVVFLAHRPVGQIVILTATVMLMLVVLTRFRPFESPAINCLFVFNEFLLLILAMHLYVFTDYVFDYTERYYIGYSAVAFVLLFLLVNVLFSLFELGYTLWLVGQRVYNQITNTNRKKISPKRDLNVTEIKLINPNNTSFEKDFMKEY